MKTKQINMTEGSIFGKLMAFSIPLILSNVLQLLFNACDTIIVGKFSGDESLAAVGSTSVIINLLTNLFLGLSIGTNVVCANFLGANNSKELSKSVHSAIVLSVISGILISVCGIFFVKPILIFMGSPEDVFPKAALYLKIYFSGITSTMIYNFGAAILKSKGDTIRPLVILIIAGIINFILNLIFVICFSLDVKGVALATVISQTFSAICILILLAKETDEYRLCFKKLRLDSKIVIKIIKIGLPAGIQGIIFSLSNLIIQTSVNSFGKIAIAGNSAAQSLEGFVYIAMNSVAQGTLTFTSQNIGAKKIDRIKKVILISQGIAFIVGLSLGNLIYFSGNTLLSFYTNNQEAIKFGLERLSLICTVYGFCGIMDCAANVIRALGYSIAPMIITLVGACGFRIFWIFTVFQIERFHNLKTIYISYVFSWILTYFILMIVLFLIFKRIKKTYKSE